MKHPVVAMYLASIIIASSGCGFSPSLLTTRTETETHHVSRIIDEDVKIEDTGEDYGVMLPQRKRMVLTRQRIRYDSTCYFYFPRLARWGLVEMAGIISTESSSRANNMGLGLLGIYNWFTHFNRKETDIFNGYYGRVGMLEWRVPFLGRNWTFGTALFEGLAADSRSGHYMFGILPFTLRYRYPLLNYPTPLTIEPFVNIGYFPNTYLNMGGKLHFGSVGGMNLFAHLGFAIAGSSINNDGDLANNYSFGYAGLGISVLDFHYSEDEMDTEWKYHEPFARRVGFLHLTFLQSSIGSETSLRFFGLNWDGIIVQAGTVAFPADFIMKNFTLGTSIANVVFLGNSTNIPMVGASILPLRATLMYQLAPKVLVEPFFEVNYYPSNFAHLGARINLGDIGGVNLGFQVGGVYGNTGELSSQFVNNYTYDVKGLYFGMSLGLMDFYSSPVVDYYRSLPSCVTPFGEY
ncbi:MAG: hypothetical protein GXO82_08310 [Chlorobi bacterium]|nr:hypothetical protein [Chlorobiota bacterium]